MVYRRGSSGESNLSIGGLGSLYTANSVYIDLQFPTQMRAGPSIEFPSGSNRFMVCPTNCVTFSSLTVIHSHKNAACISATLSSSKTAGHVGNVFAQTNNWSEGERFAFISEL